MSSGSSLGMCGSNVYEGAVKFAQAIDPTFKAANSKMILNFLQNVSAEDLLKGWKVSKRIFKVIITGGGFKVISSLFIGVNRNPI